MADRNVEKKKPVIIASHITKEYRLGKVIVHALRDLSVEVEEGSFVAIMGPSGSGKSTLLHMISALDRPTSGQVILEDEDITAASDRRLARVRSKQVGFVFQFFNLFPTMSAQDNVEFPMMIANMPGSKRRKRAKELLELVGLGDRRHHTPGELSGGQRQRVAIARSLANDPPVVFCDEPTGNLDSTASKEIMELLHRLCKEQGKTIVIVTHDPAVGAVTDRMIELCDGQICKDVKNGKGEKHDKEEKPAKKRSKRKRSAIKKTPKKAKGGEKNAE
ncbi:MAG: ABC transporter ATP-binding protein [Candidatus Undinarchaeales archaeon]|jgi:putative ABC transport system ATP-binding protein|nr:ABC transporter ATP-binding protein [Candidatus Undinarchaeales archaeon]MDP7492423.1 ABC transporter ATP-binding protein [Candidatus Undinarchaeales archaeon]